MILNELLAKFIFSAYFPLRRKEVNKHASNAPCM